LGKKSKDGITFLVTVGLGQVFVGGQQSNNFCVDEWNKVSLIVMVVVVVLVVVIVVIVVVVWWLLTLSGLVRATTLLVGVAVRLVDDTVTFMMTHSVC